MAASMVQPSSVAAVAVHGTGTPLGDPIEVGALGQGLGGPSAGAQPRGRPLLLVSNKACFGHTEGTAGMSGESDVFYASRRRSGTVAAAHAV